MGLAWTVGVCHVPLLVYVLLVVYPSVSLTHVRSFAEHRADDHSQLRTNVVEAGPIWALLFLNNNLHIAHHLRPHLPWYELPRAWREMRHSALGARSGCGVQRRLSRGVPEISLPSLHHR